MYMKIDPRSGKGTGGFLEGTNKLIRSSISPEYPYRSDRERTKSKRRKLWKFRRYYGSSLLNNASEQTGVGICRDRHRSSQSRSSVEGNMRRSDKRPKMFSKEGEPGSIDIRKDDSKSLEVLGQQ